MTVITVGAYRKKVSTDEQIGLWDTIESATPA